VSDVAALVADNLDIWTGAIERKNGAGRGPGGKRISLYGIERLRALILDLAVRGKLVPQDPADEPAAELLKQVDKARPKLVEGGYLARSKAQVDRTSPVAPFAIPTTWAWIRLDRLGAIVGGGTPSSSDQSCFTDSGDGISWLTPADLSGFTGRYIEHGNRDLTDKGLGSSSAKVMPKGTVLFTSRAPIGYVAIAANPISTNQGFKSVVPSIDGMSEFIAMVLSAFAEEIDKNAPGTTFKEVSGKIVSAIAFPLPPFAEQRRIVTKVDELMALCDALERESADALAAHQVLVESFLVTLVNSAEAADLAANWARLESHFDILFTTEASTDALKQTILDLAVSGKLVEQEGNWPVEPLGNYVKDAAAGWSPKCIETPRSGDNWGVLKVSAVTWGRFQPEENKELPYSLEPRPEIEVAPGDFLISRANTAELVARSVVVPLNAPRKLMMSDKIIRFRFNDKVDADYINLVHASPFARAYYARVAGGTSSSMKNVSQSQIRALKIPIPPLAEQQRIVAKVEELLALCDALKARLGDVAETRRHLANAIVERSAA